MKKLQHLILLLFLCNHVFAQKFEGIITFKMNAQGKELEMKAVTKDGKIKLQMEMYGMKMDQLLKEKAVIYSIVHAQKMVLKMTIPNTINQSNIQCNVKLTGEKKEILGFSCESFETECSDKSSLKGWISKDLDFSLADIMKATNGNEIEQAQLPKGSVIKMSGKGKKNEEFSLEIVKLERKSVSDTEFDIPEGYMLQDMGSMPGR